MPRTYPRKSVKFCFTYNIPNGTTATAAQAQMLVELQANQAVVYAVFQQEEGTHKHLQGTFRLDTSSRSCDWVRENFAMLGHATVSICRNWMASVKYCQKEDTRIAGTTPSVFGDVSVLLDPKFGAWDNYVGSFWYDNNELWCREILD